MKRIKANTTTEKKHIVKKIVPIMPIIYRLGATVVLGMKA